MAHDMTVLRTTSKNEFKQQNVKSTVAYFAYRQKKRNISSILLLWFNLLHNQNRRIMH